MSLETTDSKVIHVIAAAADYPIPFKFFEKTDLKVCTGNAGTLTELVLDYDYMVGNLISNVLTPADDYPNGATLRLITTQTIGHTLAISRVLPLTQPDKLPSSGTLNTESLERRLDKMTMMIQQLSEQMSRAIQVSETAVLDPVTHMPIIDAADVLTAIFNVQEDVALKKSQVETLLASNVYGVIPNCICAVDLSAFTLVNCYMDTVLKIRKADANLGYPATGFVIDAALTGAAVTVYRAGVAGGFAGLTPGLDAYLSTSGGITQDPDAEPTLCAQPVGFAISTTTAFIQPAVPLML